jgi:hypothetical protein
LEFTRDPIHPSLQGRTVDLAVAERPPVGEQAVDDFQAGSANCFSGSSSIDQLLKITFQVSPANLTQFQREFAVGTPAIATDDSPGRLAQQGVTTGLILSSLPECPI